jgi:hypothetical protein
MSTFAFNVKVNDPFASITEAALGASTGDGWGDEEVGKAVKLGPANNYILATADDPIEGFVVGVEPNTVNQGFSFGSVQRNCRVEVVLSVGETGVVVGDTVTADTQEVVGTQTNGNKALVQQEGTPGDAGDFVWRVIALRTDGEAGSTVLIERV